jgi:acetylcholinesterase
MVMHGGKQERLFRGAFMQSGAVTPVDDVLKGQLVQDEIAARVGCSQANDVLQCLREVDFDKLKAALDASRSCMGYNVLSIASYLGQS